MGMTGKELHDLLLENKPEDASHDSGTCQHCDPQGQPSQEANVTEAIFTKEQHEQLLSAAVEEARQKATADVDAEVLSLNERLTKAEADLAAKETEIGDLRSQIEAAAEEVKLQALADTRSKEVASVTTFNQDQLEARKARWAGMSEEDFNATLDDYKAIAEKPSIARESAFDQTRPATESTEVESLAGFFAHGLEVATKL